jgi:hypothetical protein
MGMVVGDLSCQVADIEWSVLGGKTAKVDQKECRLKKGVD